MAFGVNISIGNQGTFPGLEQSFSTIPVPNFMSALYELVIRAPNPTQSLFASYIFPLSPSSLSKEFTAMTNYYDVQGSASQNGVQRIVDQYGNSPVTYTLRGTTGWQYHSNDGFAFTGLDSIIAIENLLNQYAQLNQIQAQANQPLYTLEFYDYFKGDFWQIVPMGRQGISQSAERPLLFEYFFRFVGVRSLDTIVPSTINDPIAQDFATPAFEAQAVLTSNVSTSLSRYQSVTAAGSIILSVAA